MKCERGEKNLAENDNPEKDNRNKCHIRSKGHKNAIQNFIVIMSDYSITENKKLKYKMINGWFLRR